MNVKDMGNAAIGLTKNPLGVIGLFVVMVYGFACLVLGLGAQQLLPEERSPLIWFIVGFPILILSAFVFLVTKHHRKLYAPSDYRDEANFLQGPMSDQERQVRLEAEVLRAAKDEAAASKETGATERVDASAAAGPEAPGRVGGSKKMAPPIAPEDDETSIAEAELLERRVNFLRPIYANAERLAFLQLEKDIGKPFQKYVRVEAHGRQFEFDGALITDEEAQFIEVKYFSTPTFNKKAFEYFIEKAKAFLSGGRVKNSKTYLWVACVCGFERKWMPDFEGMVRRHMEGDASHVNLRFYHVDDLIERYG